MAVRYRKKGPVHWLNCVVFKTDLNELVKSSVPKGRFVQVVGRLEVRVWQKDGNNRRREVHVCNQVVLLPRETYVLDDVQSLPA